MDGPEEEAYIPLGATPPPADSQDELFEYLLNSIRAPESSPGRQRSRSPVPKRETGFSPRPLRGGEYYNQTSVSPPPAFSLLSDPPFYDWTKEKEGGIPTKCSGALDMAKITIAADGQTPVYNGTPMELLENAMKDVQGSVGAVSKWKSTDGTNVRVVVKVVKDLPADLLTEVRDGIEMAMQLATCDLVRFKAFDMEVDGEPRIVTVMESLSSDAFTVASRWNGLLPEEKKYKDIAIEMANFLTRLLECVQSGKATLMDMKLENIGYCEDDGKFRLIDVDSLNSNTLTTPYNLKKYVDNRLQTVYAFGVTMAQFLLQTKNYGALDPEMLMRDRNVLTELSYGHPVVLVKVISESIIIEALIKANSKMTEEQRLKNAKFKKYYLENGEKVSYGEKYSYAEVVSVYGNGNWWFRDGFETGRNPLAPPDRTIVKPFFMWLMLSTWISKDGAMNEVRNLIQNAYDIFT